MNIKDVKLSDLTDAEVEVLYDLTIHEYHYRLRNRVFQGEFPPPSDLEKSLYTSNNRLQAIRDYRQRCQAQGTHIKLSEAIAVFRGVF